jgi:hypothetical protein
MLVDEDEGGGVVASSDEARRGRKGTPMPAGGSRSGAWATVAVVVTSRLTRRPDRGPRGESGGRPARRIRLASHVAIDIVHDKNDKYQTRQQRNKICAT